MEDDIPALGENAVDYRCWNYVHAAVYRDQHHHLLQP